MIGQVVAKLCAHARLRLSPQLAQASDPRHIKLQREFQQFKMEFVKEKLLEWGLDRFGEIFEGKNAYFA